MQSRSNRPGGGARAVRVRSRPLAQIDEAKIALAVQVMAKRLRDAASTAEAPAEKQAVDREGSEA